MTEINYPLESPEDKTIYSLRILTAIGIIVGCWSLLFEIYFFHGFTIAIYFARIIFTAIALIIFIFSYRNFARKFSTQLTHIYLISLFSSFVITIFKMPATVFINSQLLALLIFTSAIIFSWETKHQIIAAIYYNLLFAISIIFNDPSIYRLPNIFSLVIFVCLISFLSVATSLVIHNLRKKLLLVANKREEAVSLLLNETIEKEKIAQRALIEKKRKIELLAKINHEVKTPISSILMYFEMMEEGSLNSQDEIKKYSKSVKTSLQRLLNTINNFVDYAKIETGKLEVVNDLFNLNEEIEYAVELLKPLAQSKNNELEIINNNHSHKLVYSDPVKYRQILINIIANALRFTANGSVKVTYENLQKSEGMYEIRTSVEDSGPGIPDDKLKSIFNPFVSLRDGDKMNYGSGLGLTICNEFVNMLKGEINIESTIGVGTKFTVKIPYNYNYDKVILP
jgi:signal transduction histidine kinase